MGEGDTETSPVLTLEDCVNLAKLAGIEVLMSRDNVWGLRTEFVFRYANGKRGSVELLGEDVEQWKEQIARIVSRMTG